MIQRNMDEQYLTERNVRRRPEFQSAKDFQQEFIIFKVTRVVNMNLGFMD